MRPTKSATQCSTLWSPIGAVLRRILLANGRAFGVELPGRRLASRQLAPFDDADTSGEELGERCVLTFAVRNVLNRR